MITNIEYRFSDDELAREIELKSGVKIPFMAYKMQQWKNDPFLWMVEQVFTIDESDSENPVKPFPAYRYLKEVIREYFDNKVLVVSKTRRMMATHLFTALAVHQLLFVPFSENIIVSINEDRAKKVIQTRCKKIIEYLDPRFPYPEFKDKEDFLVAEIHNPVNGATITALPSGSDKCRGLTVTNAFYDEFAFQKNCEENLKALKPALEGENCRAAIVSTPKFATVFQELVSNVNKDANFQVIMEGLTKVRNKYNQTVLSLHYKADPGKRTEEWYHRERYGTDVNGKPIPGCSGVDSFTWEQEYELSFSVPTGKPVVPEFDKTQHCDKYKELGGFIEGRPLHVGFDFGTHFPAVVFCQVDSLNRCILHNGIMAEDEELDAFMSRVEDFIRREFPGCDDNFVLHADPAGRSGNSQGTAAPAIDLLEQRFKKRVMTPKSKPVDRCRAIRNKMSKKIHDSMGVIINPAAGIHIRPDGEERHGIIVEALETGWVYKTPKPGENYSGEEPKKDGFYDHLMDAWGYIFIALFPSLHDRAVEFRRGVSKPKPKRRHLRL